MWTRPATFCRVGSRRSAAVDGRYRAYGPGERFLGLVEVAAGQVRAVRLVATLPADTAVETAGADETAR